MEFQALGYQEPQEKAFSLRFMKFSGISIQSAKNNLGRGSKKTQFWYYFKTYDFK